MSISNFGSIYLLLFSYIINATLFFVFLLENVFHIFVLKKNKILAGNVAAFIFSALPMRKSFHICLSF